MNGAAIGVVVVQLEASQRQAELQHMQKAGEAVLAREIGSSREAKV